MDTREATLIIGVVREARPGETRVSATPGTVTQLIKLGYEVVVEPGAGAAPVQADSGNGSGARWPVAGPRHP